MPSNPCWASCQRPNLSHPAPLPPHSLESQHLSSCLLYLYQALPLCPYSDPSPTRIQFSAAAHSRRGLWLVSRVTWPHSGAWLWPRACLQGWALSRLLKIPFLLAPVHLISRAKACVPRRWGLVPFPATQVPRSRPPRGSPKPTAGAPSSLEGGARLTLRAPLPGTQGRDPGGARRSETRAGRDGPGAGPVELPVSRPRPRPICCGRLGPRQAQGGQGREGGTLQFQAGARGSGQSREERWAGRP